MRIADPETGELLPAGRVGTIYFERHDGPLFTYHNDPEKTRASRHPEHDDWGTTGDLGYLDDDGWLYLTDRKAFMIISGGVNIYPREAEDALALHPAVLRRRRDRRAGRGDGRGRAGRGAARARTPSRARSWSAS